MNFGSVCSGIGAPEVAWQPMGWRCAFVSEIEQFPRTVLQRRLGAGSAIGPALHGDFTTIEAGQYEPIELLVGGTPCQSFSIAGLRGGLDDDRGNLALEYLRLAERLRPRWLVWENVPGVLSSNGGRDFGSVLGGMVELGYGFAYRTIDAQYVRVDSFARAVPQRRRRVFVVGHLGDWRPAAAVLFERESLSGNSAPRRQAGEGIAGTTGDGVAISCPPVSPAMKSRDHKGPSSDGDGDGDGDGLPLVAHSLRAEGFDASEAGTLEARAVPQAVAFNITPSNSNKDYNAREAKYAQALTSGGNTPSARGGDLITQPYAVRRLTPTECERLQGFPDDWTRIPWRGKPAEDCPDGPRYKSLGNAMAVNAMRWIGRRIQMVEGIA